MPRESERLFEERPQRWADQVQSYQRSVNTFHQAVLHWHSRARISSVPPGERQPRMRSLSTPLDTAPSSQNLPKQSASTLPDRPPAGSRDPRLESPNGSGLLTDRQREIAIEIALGLTNRQIAEKLVITPGTVANHVEHILTRLDFRCRAQVAVWAVEQGLVAPIRERSVEVDESKRYSA
jgi:DNA-binding CsgD family transcriptional regulator